MSLFANQTPNKYTPLKVNTKLIKEFSFTCTTGSFSSMDIDMFFVVFVFGLFASFLKPCSCHYGSLDRHAWFPARATWYGAPNGAGSTGGACCYKDAVEKPPFNSMIAAGGPSLYKSGTGCGTCYKVKCKKHASCSGFPVTVVITDECAGCTSHATHFDLSGAAFGALAKPGHSDKLRHAGVLRVRYKRTPCNYRRANIAFAMDDGSNPYYLAFVVKFVDGDGNLAAVEILQGKIWLPMQEMRSAVWKLNSVIPLKGPISIRLTSGQTREVVIAFNVIPADWRCGQTYQSFVNFH